MTNMLIVIIIEVKKMISLVIRCLKVYLLFLDNIVIFFFFTKLL